MVAKASFDIRLAAAIFRSWSCYSDLVQTLCTLCMLLDTLLGACSFYCFYNCSAGLHSLPMASGKVVIMLHILGTQLVAQLYVLFIADLV